MNAVYNNRHLGIGIGPLPEKLWPVVLSYSQWESFNGNGDHEVEFRRYHMP